MTMTPTSRRLQRHWRLPLWAQTPVCRKYQHYQIVPCVQNHKRYLFNIYIIWISVCWTLLQKKEREKKKSMYLYSTFKKRRMYICLKKITGTEDEKKSVHWTAKCTFVYTHKQASVYEYTLFKLTESQRSGFEHKWIKRKVNTSWFLR